MTRSQRNPARRPLITAVAIAIALATSDHGAWAAQPSALGQPIDGIQCQSMEGAVFHIHQHLAVFDHGKPVAIPENMGQVPGTCLYWIHTHTPDGIIHVESPNFRTFTLGNLFDVWGQPLTPTSVATARIKKGQLRVYVNGNLYRADPRAIELAQHTDITIEAGPPYAKPALFTNWGAN